MTRPYGTYRPARRTHAKAEVYMRNVSRKKGEPRTKLRDIWRKFLFRGMR